MKCILYGVYKNRYELRYYLRKSTIHDICVYEAYRNEG